MGTDTEALARWAIISRVVQAVVSLCCNCPGSGLGSTGARLARQGGELRVGRQQRELEVHGQDRQTKTARKH